MEALVILIIMPILTFGIGFHYGWKTGQKEAEERLEKTQWNGKT